MRVLIGGGSANQTSVRIAAAWRALGLEVEVGDVARLRRLARPDDRVLARLDVLPTLDGVEPGLFELLLLERHGARVLNTAAALVRAHDKLRTSRMLERAGLPHPRTAWISNERPILPLTPPVVVKPRFGSWGSDVVRCQALHDFHRCVAELRTRSWFHRHGALVQELIPPRGYDLRLLVARGSVVGAVKRVAARGEWRTNISLGGTRRACAPPAHACALAARAAAAIGADFVGVDLLPLDRGFTVLELNGAVEFDPVYARPGRDVYADVAVALGLVPGCPKRPRPARPEESRTAHGFVTTP